jgi:hypothetical protein
MGRVPTVADVAVQVTGRDWSRFATDRASAWAATYFDHGQCIWPSADRTATPYVAWKEEASIDRTPEVMGLRRLRARVRALPDAPGAAAEHVLGRLAVDGQLLPLYLHALLRRAGGWSAHAARFGFEANAQRSDAVRAAKLDTERPLRDNSYAKRFECLDIERLARCVVADSENDVVKHGFPEVCGLREAKRLSSPTRRHRCSREGRRVTAGRVEHVVEGQGRYPRLQRFQSGVTSDH